MKKSDLRLLSCSALALTAALLLSGCCHTQTFIDAAPETMTAQGEWKPVAVGSALNSGYYLFNTWPIYTGNPNRPNRKDYRSFHHDIQPGRNASMLLRDMQRKYKAEKLTQIEHTESSWGYFSLWILWRKTIRTTAIGVKEIKKK